MFGRRWWLFWTGLCLTLPAAWLSFTPTVWWIEGRPDESYPELFFLGLVLPAALLVMLAGLFVGLRRSRNKINRKDGSHV